LGPETSKSDATVIALSVKSTALHLQKSILATIMDHQPYKFLLKYNYFAPASVVQATEIQCAPTGMVYRRSWGSIPRVGQYISCLDFRGASFEINFSGKQKGLDGVTL